MFPPQGQSSPIPIVRHNAVSLHLIFEAWGGVFAGNPSGPHRIGTTPRAMHYAR